MSFNTPEEIWMIIAAIYHRLFMHYTIYLCSTCTYARGVVMVAVAVKRGNHLAVAMAADPVSHHKEAKPE